MLYDAEDDVKGVSLADVLVHLLAYAGDDAVLDEGSPEGIQRLSSRQSDVHLKGLKEGRRHGPEQGENRKPNRCISKNKIRPLQTTSEETSEKCRFTCPHLNCGLIYVHDDGRPPCPHDKV